MTLLLVGFLVLALFGVAWAMGDSGNVIALVIALAGLAGLVFTLVNFRRYRVAKPLRPEDGELLESTKD